MSENTGQYSLGISPKVWAPVALQLLALLVNWAASGEFDRVEVSQALLAAGTAIVGYLAGPGYVAGVIVGKPPKNRKLGLARTGRKAPR